MCHVNEADDVMVLLSGVCKSQITVESDHSISAGVCQHLAVYHIPLSCVSQKIGKMMQFNKMVAAMLPIAY